MDHRQLLLAPSEGLCSENKADVTEESASFLPTTLVQKEDLTFSARSDYEQLATENPLSASTSLGNEGLSSLRNFLENFNTSENRTTEKNDEGAAELIILDLTSGQAVPMNNQDGVDVTISDDIQMLDHVENDEDRNDDIQNTVIWSVPSESLHSRKRSLQVLDVTPEEELTKKAKPLEGKGKLDLKEAGCAPTCQKKCTTAFSHENRQKINDNFVNMPKHERKIFILHTCKRFISNDNQKKFIYHLKLDDVDGGYDIEVCKPFYLTTLGFHKNNDTFVYNVLSKTEKNSLTPPEDRRGKTRPKTYIDRTVVKTHIASFHPTASHYRRAHAPNVRYLPSDVTIQFMYQDLKNKFSDYNFSYEFYRKALQEENIHFTRLGHELCEKCQLHDLHRNNHPEAVESCYECNEAQIHKAKYTNARALYKSHSETQFADDTICFSTDMQKVIMLPRMEEFKVVLFTRRLSVYNQTFVPVGTKQKQHPYLSVLWHAALSGRDKEDVISAFRQFFLQFRDMKKIIIWLDNCAAQNKNWTLLTFLVSYVNSECIQAETITFCYFEPGHTFMSSDTFHHMIELSMKKQKFVYDFEDMKKAVALSRKGTNAVVVKEMRPEDFFKFSDESSASKRNGPSKKPYRKRQKYRNSNHDDSSAQPSSPEDDKKILLKDIVQLQARRGSYELYYKEDHKSEIWTTLDFLKTSVKISKTFPQPPNKTEPRGIPSAIKKDIMKNVVPLMPEGRKIFWRELPESEVDQD